MRGDVAKAREGLQRGIAADLENDDIVYYALWMRLLEKQLKVPTDGAADRVLASRHRRRRMDWQDLARFGAGR